MKDETSQLVDRIAELESQVEGLNASFGKAGVRRRSEATLFGLPLYDIALGPDPASGEMRGHARGIFAVGDIATGVAAFGGIARGLIALGGVAFGGIAIGGCAIGLLLAFGGFALGTIAVGGGAVGLIAVGGGTVGYYAFGGGAFGKYVVSGAHIDPEAFEFFKKWFPQLTEIIKRPPG
ncbi:MAG: hypothetical protein RH917_09015 [Lacipirellulaceae bacterium]